ncbi:MAG: 3'(2'),5'-bisphosphate nucleotidase CysQ [Nitrospinota bacterium]|nr:3'(2'),5'-bisphosphate nucleotidase CysQ [Nitrospinota bacterium]
MTENPDLARLAPQVALIAAKAGQAAMEHYTKAEGAVMTKEDNSPLTLADLASHRHIIEKLRELTPDIPILSEESTEDITYDMRRGWRRFWLVDPLDGTKEFIKRNGEFTVNIALMEDKHPVLGAVDAPALGKAYFAWKGGGAYRVTGEEPPTRIHVADYRNRRLMVVASRSHQTPELKQFLDRLGDCDVVSSGSSLKLMMVAEGSAHLYPRIGYTMEWDTAAAQVVVEEAGGQVTDLSGERLGYNKESLRNPYFMVSGEPAYPWLELVEGI